jgi:hypothetical protein
MGNAETGRVSDFQPDFRPDADLGSTQTFDDRANWVRERMIVRTRVQTSRTAREGGIK